MDPKAVKRVLVVGAGTMGNGIAQVFARAGIEVGLVDVNEPTLNLAKDRIESGLKTLVEYGPVPLLEEAVQHGFEDNKGGYATKCHLCYETRAFFWEKGLHTDEVGPGEVYTD